MQEISQLDLFGTGLKTAAMLFIVLGLLLLFLHVARKFLLSRRLTGKGPDIRVLSTLPLTNRDRIHVVEISGQRLVLGVSPGNITFLANLENPEKENGIAGGNDTDGSEETA